MEGITLNINELWKKCMNIVKDNIDGAAFNTWFTPIVPLSYKNNSLLIQVPSHYFFEHIESKYADLIGKAIYRITGKSTKLNYSVIVSYPNGTVKIPAETALEKKTEVKSGRSNPFDKVICSDFDSQLNPSLTFDNYISGKSNILARTAGLSISESPGNNVFNPLFLHGKSGVGKTHLLHAIGNEALKKNINLRILYVSSHVFQVQYSQAYLDHTINDFIHFYQSVDLLMVDDIHELSGKEGTQNVFFHVFNHLHQNGKQIIITCDRTPKDLKKIEERLLTRFKWGLTAEIEKPDYDMRISILKSKIEKEGLIFPKEVIEYIAKNANESIRDLEGIVVSMMAHSLIQKSEINMTLAKQIVNNTVNIKKNTLSVDLIKEKVCEYYNIDTNTLLSKSKKQELAQARQIAMYLSRKLTGKSLSAIGKEIGNRNHATVLYACNAISNFIETDKKIQAGVKEIENSITNN